MERLYLVGTSHLDLKGPERLGKFLEYVRPDLIGVESTKEYFLQRIEDRQLLDSQKTLLGAVLTLNYGRVKASRIISFMKMVGYELWVPDQYKRKTGTPILYCDLDIKVPILSKVIEQMSDDMVDENNNMNQKYYEAIANTDPEQLQVETDKSYQEHDIGNLNEDPELFQKMVIDRDINFAKQILQGFNKDGSAFVFVGGSMHFFGNYQPNLYDRLKDLNPIRVTLPEMDKFPPL